MNILSIKEAEILKQNDIKLYSFDIFDTLVTRRVATPTGIFALMQEYLKKNSGIPDFIKNDFYEIRINSERLARLRNGNVKILKEVCFNDIYHTMQNNYGLSNNETDFLKKLEIKTEIENLIPIASNINILKSLLKKDCRVVLISDMYFSVKELKAILTHIDPIFEDMNIYVSSEHSASKHNGELYSIVQNVENINYKNWLHVGDNKYADIKKAQEKGIKTILFNPPELMPYEKEVLINTDVISQCLIGTARISRLNLPEINCEKYIFGASFAAPLLFSYVNYIIDQAHIRNFKTLYFIARDGFVPKIIADIIIKEKNLNIKTKYIYGSRLAWRIPTKENYEFLIEIFFEEYKDKLSVDFISYRLGIENKLLNKYRKCSVKNLKEALLKDTTLKNKIIELNSRKANLLKEYFKQELDLDSKELVFVDLFGSGISQDLISSFLNKKIYGFYFNVLPRLLNENSVKISYNKDFAYAHWIELLSKTVDGQTIGYRSNGNNIVPITEDWKGKKLLEDWGIKEYYEGIETFTHNITDLNSNLILNSYNFVNKYLNYVLNSDKATADIIGSIPYKMVGNEKDVEVCADSLKTSQIIFNFLLCRKNIYKSALPPITLSRSSFANRKILKFIEKYPTIQKFLFNIYIHKKKQRSIYLNFRNKIFSKKILYKKVKL